MFTRALAASAALALLASVAAAQPGNAADPITIKMKRGSDSVRIVGVLRPEVACCTYVFKAKAGQKLYWSVTGASTRQTIGYPGGGVDGPGLPDPLPLPATGAYVLSVTPDLMAEGAYGRFVLKLRVPPLKAK
ncbi:MAG TPA: hypothetical protein VHZ26_02460 [Caulobacteraceae bacterium]|jgi:hypothetical protein|nr:hypothetical protein [Caulobacteraceae bacterium]